MLFYGPQGLDAALRLKRVVGLAFGILNRVVDNSAQRGRFVFLHGTPQGVAESAGGGICTSGSFRAGLDEPTKFVMVVVYLQCSRHGFSTMQRAGVIPRPSITISSVL